MNNQSFGTPTWESRRKMTFRCSPHGEAQNILQEGEWCLFPKVIGHEKLVFEVVLTKSVVPFPFNLHYLPFLLVIQVDLILNFHL